MPQKLSPAERETLEQWLAALRTALDVPDAQFPVERMLGLTGRVAHCVLRPAVPPTAYLMGVCVGRALAEGQDQETALRRALETVDGLVPADRGRPTDAAPRAGTATSKTQEN